MAIIRKGTKLKKKNLCYFSQDQEMIILLLTTSLEGCKHNALIAWGWADISATLHF
jgi:hypothetical protein